MRWGSLCSGIEAPAVAWKDFGWTQLFCAETDKNCAKLISRYGIPNYGDITKIESLPKVDLIIAGDPCQSRSIVNQFHKKSKSKHPDLSGYVLSLIGRTMPKWVVRENVRSSDITDFQVGLELCGYSTILTEFNSADFTCQSRRRYYVIGYLGKIDELFIKKKL
jgi:site-specific DNA-cytosine methylase